MKLTVVLLSLALLVSVQADGTQKGADHKDPPNQPGIFSKIKDSVATAVDKVKESMATAFDKVKIGVSNLQERAASLIHSPQEDDELDQQSKYDLEQVMKFVFRMADLKSVESINQYELHVRPGHASLKCVTERQHWRIVKIIKDCEREADIMMKMMKSTAHFQDSHDSGRKERHRREFRGPHGRSPPCDGSHKDVMEEMHEMAVGNCFLNEIAGSTKVSAVSVLDEAKLKVEINNTALAAPNKIKAIADLHTCIGTNNKDVTALVDIIADVRPIVTEMIKPMVNNMFNNIQPNINTIMQMQGKFDEVKNHMSILKGTVCLVESLAKNGCGVEEKHH